MREEKSTGVGNWDGSSGMPCRSLGGCRTRLRGLIIEYLLFTLEKEKKIQRDDVSEFCDRLKLYARRSLE